MPAKKYLIALTQEEHQQLEKVARSNRHSIREKTRARILLLPILNTQVATLAGAGSSHSGLSGRVRLLKPNSPENLR